MALSTFVKICNISNLSEARYCAGMGVDQLGFNLNPNDKQAISIETFMDIKEWIAGVDLIGEFGDIGQNDLLEIPQQLPLDLIETSNLELVEILGQQGRRISFRIEIFHHLHVIDLLETLQQLESHSVEQVIIESNSKQLLDEIKTEVNSFSGNLRIIKAFNVHLDSLSQLDGFQGIQLEGSEEDQPGLKDYGEVMDILEALEIDD